MASISPPALCIFFCNTNIPVCDSYNSQARGVFCFSNPAFSRTEITSLISYGVSRSVPPDYPFVIAHRFREKGGKASKDNILSSSIINHQLSFQIRIQRSVQGRIRCVNRLFTLPGCLVGNGYGFRYHDARSHFDRLVLFTFFEGFLQQFHT